MNFRDVFSQGELICNLNSEINGNSLKISWTWPMGSNKIIVVLVPEEQDFKENMYESYKKFIVYASENKNYFIDTVDLTSKTKNKYYIFSSDSSDENVLIRQSQHSNPVLCPNSTITVRYCLTKAKDKFSISDLFKKDKSNTWELKIICNMDLEYKDLYYRFISPAEQTGGFCFPSILKKNQCINFSDIELAENQTIQIYTDKSNIKLVKVNNL